MCALLTATLCFIVLFSSTAYSNDESYYVMLIPTVIYEHSSVSMGLYTEGYKNDEQIQVKLQKQPNWIYYQDVETVQISANSAIDQVQFTVPVLEHTPYRFQILGPGETDPNIDVNVVKHPVIVLIQTDKPLYKPGDTIKFRVLVVDHLTRPIKTLETIKVQLKDSKKTLINEWSSARLHQGVFQSQIDLANFIPYGEWTLKAWTTEGVEKTKTFDVAEYVLPLHEIHISTPRRVLMRDETLELVIDAKYTFGKPIRGAITLAFDGIEHSGIYEINGRSIINIPLKDVVDENNFSNDDYGLRVDVNITQTESDQIYTANQVIRIHKRFHKISLRKSSEYILNEESIWLWFTVTDPDEVPLTNPGVMNISVYLEPRYWYNNHRHYYEMKPDDAGIINLQLTSTSSNRRIVLEVTYEGEQIKFEIHRENESDENQKPFFKASLLVRKPMINKPVAVMVQSSFRMNLVQYHVISQGQIMASGRVAVKRKRTVSFTFSATFPMVPEASLVVFAIDKGILWTDVMRFNVHGLNNKVDIEISSNNTEPRSKIGLNVKSKPGSMVGLLAVDRSLLQLGTGNDITQQLVFEQLGQRRTKENANIESLGFTVLTNAQRQVEIPFEELASRSIMSMIAPRFGDDDDEFPTFDMTTPSAPIIVRKHFPETWLWTEMVPVDDNGNFKLEETVPDTITGWSISAFAIDAVHGLGVIESPVSLTVQKPFFITVNLPYSIVKTETATVEVFVHNYFNLAQYVTVRVQNKHEDFHFVDEKDAVKSNLEDSKTLVAGNSVQKVIFLLKPTRSGNPAITVYANSSTAADAVQRNLRVTPGGLQFFENMPYFIEVDNESKFYHPINLVVPGNATKGSVSITLTVEGFLLGAALNNLDHIIRLPSGCGEQNLLNLVPSVIALEYMANTETLTYATKTKAKGYLRIGYQNQLKYMLKDGSFSVFGEYDGRGSVFLTALVAKVFNITERHITVDSKVILKALNWLQKQQSKDGRFTESGRLFYKALQSDLQDGATLTAYVLITFLERQSLPTRYNSVVEKGTEYISNERHLNGNSYSLALIAYVLQLAEHPRRQRFFDKLVQTSQRNEDLSLRWWGNGSTSIETTAYALLTYMSKGEYVDAKPIMKWLVSQRYDKGGYDNTQNTFVGLQALGQYSRKMSLKNQNYDVIVTYADKTHRLHMDPESARNGGHKLSLPEHVRRVEVKVEGTGAGVFQIAYRYNKVAYDNLPRFKIEKTLRKTARGMFKMNICTNYQPVKTDEELNMVLMEVMFPSGYVVTNSIKKDLSNNKKVRKAELEDSNTRLILYFDPLLRDIPVCVDVEALRKAIVLNQAPGWIKVYDYYDPTREAIEYFNPAED